VTPHGFTEDQLAERLALEVLKALGWTVVSAAEEVFGAGGTLGRETPGDTVLLPRLEAALRSLNPALPAEAISGAVHVLTRDRSALSLVAANREVWELLRDGVAVMVHDHVHGGQRTERVRVVNWEDPAANDFLAVSQMTVTGSLYTRRADVIGFVKKAGDISAVMAKINKLLDQSIAADGYRALPGRGRLVALGERGQPLRRATRHLHREEVRGAGPDGGVDQRRSVRRPARLQIPELVIGDPSQVGAVRVHGKELVEVVA